MIVTSIPNTKIESLQALRALAILGTFLAHAHISYHWAGLGVSVFFVMSGFLLIRSDLALPAENVSVKSNFRYALKKMKKIYPLHLLTMLFAVILEFIWLIDKGITFLDIAKILGKICLNVSLLQAWVPFNFFKSSLNDVSWFLSTMLFLYFVYPWIKNWLLKQQKKCLVICCGILVFLLQTALCVPWVLKYNNSYPFYEWFMYCFPVFRTGDLIVGCVLGKVFFEKNPRPSGRWSLFIWSVYEVLMTAVTVLLSVWPFQNPALIFRAFHNWTTPYILVSAGWLVLFTLKKGIITKGFSCKPFIYFGDVSAYYFLIHFMVIGYVDCLLKLVFHYKPEGIILVLIVIAEFIISMAASGLYRKYGNPIFLNPDK